jgi:hypothetical protein
MAQAIATSTPIRSTTKSATFYIPVISHRNGPYFPERNVADSSLWQITSDIASAQYEHVTKVIAVDVAAGRSWDASAEVAREVLAQCLDYEGEVPDWCEEFLETHLGVNTVQRALSEAA